MNRRFMISVVVLFIATMIAGFVVHGLLLAADYEKLVPGMFRTPADSERHFGYMIAAHVILAVGLTWMYRAGRTSRPWLGQGVRFGLAVATVASVPTYLVYFAVQPMPSDLVAKQIVLDVIAMVLIGIVAAAVNRDAVARVPADAVAA